MESNGSASRRRVRKLRCSVMNYDWGRIGTESGVARLFSLNSRVDIEGGKPYAEFWMGTHESGPSFVVEKSENNGVVVGEEEEITAGGLSLKSWIAKNPSVLGDKVVEKWGANLPFLFKVWLLVFPFPTVGLIDRSFLDSFGVSKFLGLR